jgi:hypothetical protein
MVPLLLAEQRAVNTETLAAIVEGQPTTDIGRHDVTRRV